MRPSDPTPCHGLTSPMIDRDKELLALDLLRRGRSQRHVSRTVGIARATVRRIAAAGRLRYRKRRRPPPAPPEVPPPDYRCGTCGSRVNALPCRACWVRAHLPAGERRADGDGPQEAADLGVKIRGKTLARYLALRAAKERLCR